MTDSLHVDKHTFWIISRSILLRMKNISDKTCRETRNTHITLYNFSSEIVPFMS